MYKDAENLELKGNDRFEGFVFDIIDEISKMLGFNYVFKVVDDGNYGNLNMATGEWNGMIRELLDGVKIKQRTSCYFKLKFVWSNWTVNGFFDG